MAWTYDADLTAASDQVRFLIGDTDRDDQQIQNEEIAWALAQAGNALYPAAIRCVDALQAKYSRQVDKQVGDLRLTYSKRSDQYKDLGKKLRQEASLQSATPYAGGISLDDKDIDREDSDRTPPLFQREMHTNQHVIDPKLTQSR